MRFKERNDLANRCKEWMKDQLENNITTPLDTVHLVLAYLDANGYLNEVVLCKDCKYRTFVDWGMGDCVHPKGSKRIAFDYHYCGYGKRREDIEQ